MAKSKPATQRQPITLENLLSEEGAEQLINEIKFEDGLRLLEELVTKVEAGALPLDGAVMSYERGVLLIGKLRDLLSGAEEKLKVLQKK